MSESSRASFAAVEGAGADLCVGSFFVRLSEFTKLEFIKVRFDSSRLSSLFPSPSVPFSRLETDQRLFPLSLYLLTGDRMDPHANPRRSRDPRAARRIDQSIVQAVDERGRFQDLMKLRTPFFAAFLFEKEPKSSSGIQLECWARKGKGGENSEEQEGRRRRDASNAKRNGTDNSTSRDIME